MTFNALKMIEYCLIAITLLGLLYSAYFITKNSKIEESLTVNLESVVEKTENVLSNFSKPYEDYAMQLKARDIFLPFEAPVEVPSFGQLPANMTITGILLGEHPQIVLEDRNMNQIYFVDEKDNQGMSIKSVESGKIILNYQGQMIEIPLKGR